MPVKGLEAPLEVYELIRAATVRSRFQAAAARGLTRFVGRESELEHLRQALEHARAGHGQVMAVVGEPGVGKSRLYWEFTHPSCPGLSCPSVQCIVSAARISTRTLSHGE